MRSANRANCAQISHDFPQSGNVGSCRLCSDKSLLLRRRPKTMLWRSKGAQILVGGYHAARAMRCASHTISRATTNASIIASVCAGDGVKRSLSVPRGTVG
jgi:hypothetical protein